MTYFRFETQKMLLQTQYAAYMCICVCIPLPLDLLPPSFQLPSLSDLPVCHRTTQQTTSIYPKEVKYTTCDDD